MDTLKILKELTWQGPEFAEKRRGLAMKLQQEEGWETVRINIPSDIDSYNSGHGEGAIWLVSPEDNEDLNNEKTDGEFEAVLATGSSYYDEIEFGYVLTAEHRGEKRPVIKWDIVKDFECQKEKVMEETMGSPRSLIPAEGIELEEILTKILPGLLLAHVGGLSFGSANDKEVFVATQENLMSGKEELPVLMIKDAVKFMEETSQKGNGQEIFNQLINEISKMVVKQPNVLKAIEDRVKELKEEEQESKGMCN